MEYGIILNVGQLAMSSTMTLSARPLWPVPLRFSARECLGTRDYESRTSLGLGDSSCTVYLGVQILTVSGPRVVTNVG